MKIHLLGDSIVKSYGDDIWNFIGGWGDHIGAFLTDDVEVFNYAMGGRSTRSFLNEGRFAENGLFTVQDTPVGLGAALPHISKGDYVFLQFGHNDDNSKDSTTLVDRQVPLGEPDAQGIYPVVEPVESMQAAADSFPAGYPECLRAEGFDEAFVQANVEKMKGLLAGYGEKYYPYDSGATYKGFLKYYIDAIRARGACPVLVTSVVRIYFEGDRIQPVPGHHGGRDAYHEYPYVQAVKQIGSELKVPVLDLFTATKNMQEMLGPEDATYMQSIKDYEGNTIGEVNYGRPAKWPEEYNRRRAEPDFMAVDETHQNRIGSFVFAGLLAELMQEQGILTDKLLTVPVKQVPVPDKLIPRKKDIAAQFNKITIFTD